MATGSDVKTFVVTNQEQILCTPPVDEQVIIYGVSGALLGLAGVIGNVTLRAGLGGEAWFTLRGSVDGPLSHTFQNHKGLPPGVPLVAQTVGPGLSAALNVEFSFGNALVGPSDGPGGAQQV